MRSQKDHFSAPKAENGPHVLKTPSSISSRVRWGRETEASKSYPKGKSCTGFWASGKQAHWSTHSKPKQPASQTCSWEGWVHIIHISFQQELVRHITIFLVLTSCHVQALSLGHECASHASEAAQSVERSAAAEMPRLARGLWNLNALRRAVSSLSAPSVPSLIFSKPEQISVLCSDCTGNCLEASNLHHYS